MRRASIDLKWGVYERVYVRSLLQRLEENSSEHTRWERDLASLRQQLQQSTARDRAHFGPGLGPAGECRDDGLALGLAGHVARRVVGKVEQDDELVVVAGVLRERLLETLERLRDTGTAPVGSGPRSNPGGTDRGGDG